MNGLDIDPDIVVAVEEWAAERVSIRAAAAATATDKLYAELQNYRHKHDSMMQYEMRKRMDMIMHAQMNEKMRQQMLEEMHRQMEMAYNSY